MANNKGTWTRGVNGNPAGRPKTAPFLKAAKALAETTDSLLIEIRNRAAAGDRQSQRWLADNVEGHRFYSPRTGRTE